jgi:3D (Asp-Asp-Asp) domain-containing protein
MTRVSIGTGTHGYVAGYGNREIEVWADTMYAAKTAAVDYFKPSKARAHQVWIALAQKPGGEQVVHVADF